MAVFTSDGLIGRVTRVNQLSSQVDLLSTNTRAENYQSIFNIILKCFWIN